MDPRRNPFVPGASIQPCELAGRPAKGAMLLGLCGVGKTVLLNRLRDLAELQG